MENYLNKITINPDVCNGKPTIRGMRITVKTILEFLAAGESIENILKAYPILEREDISAALQYASAILDKNVSSSPQLSLWLPLIMELRYLVDVNLPKHFRFFNADNFLHVVDINPCFLWSKTPK